MINFFAKNENFDLKKFLENEQIIMSQWETSSHDEIKDPKDLIYRFSLYMCHINDEMKEVVDAFLHETRDNFVKEIIDVAMYTASAINLFAMIYETLPNKDRDHMIFDEINTVFVNDPMDRIITTKDMVSFVSYSLSIIRENFPQRKWHKQSVEFTDDEYKKVLEESWIVGCGIINSLINYAIISSNKRDVSCFINEKQMKIVKDALETGTNHSPELLAKLRGLEYELK